VNPVNANEILDVDLTFICDYKDNNEYRKSFNQLSALVFGLDFEEWYQKGFWNDRYICHSILKDNKVVANVSVSKMDLIINGLNKKAIQIGTVMTLPQYRGRGLSRWLMRHVLGMYESDCDIFFLFANKSVLEYYPKFGFSAVSESRFTVKLEPISIMEACLRKLNCSQEDDLELIKRMVRSRRPVSERFGAKNSLGIFMFYALNVFPECLYYSPEDDAVVVFRHKGQTLHLYDVVSQGDVHFDGLISRIANEDTQNVRFYFTPDRFTEHAMYEPMDNEEDILFVKPGDILNNMAAFSAPKLVHA
jgi:GNAT superfamily N-acetyltransferase